MLQRLAVTNTGDHKQLERSECSTGDDHLCVGRKMERHAGSFHVYACGILVAIGEYALREGGVRVCHKTGLSER